MPNNQKKTTATRTFLLYLDEDAPGSLRMFINLQRASRSLDRISPGHFVAIGQQPAVLDVLDTCPLAVQKCEVLG